MSVAIWPKQPIEIVQSFEARRPRRGPIGALVLWAVWGVESLHYLDDLDDEHNNILRNNPPHDPQVKDISHIRWATGAAISSLDLCAAALGRECCAWNRINEPDLRDFDATSTSRNSSKHRMMLPSPALSWIDGVLSDTRYTEVHGARNPLTHSRLIRNLFLNSPTKFQISTTGSAFTAGELVVLSRDLATDKVNEFLRVLDTL
jgi:hypothetical protein